MKAHEAAELFPMMDAPRFAELVESIREHGQREPITVCDGKVLDGRNRAKACEELGLDVKAKTFDGDPFAYVWDLNGQRRDLTADQRYLIWKAAHEQSEAWRVRQQKIQDKANRKRSETQRGVPKTSMSELWAADQQRKAERVNTGSVSTSGDPNVGARARANASHTNRGTVQRMDQLSGRRPDLAEKVARGELKGAEAMRLMRKDEVSQKAGELPEGKHRIIYADPPWSYGNSGAIADSDHYSRVERHYPAMSTADICAMPVKDICADDAVLFLWVTSPLLEDGLKVVAAWGFKYKSSFVWNKLRHNFGHYNSVRHEFLLVATRGACTPDADKLEPSVVEHKRGEHSEKPEVFREIIDRMYAHGPRVELFARGGLPDNWTGWGNEVDAVLRETA